MLNLSDIQTFCKTEEKTVKIKAWNGEVRIRQLSTAQRAEVVEIIQGEGGVSNENIKFSNVIKAQILTAHYALVEPNLTTKQLEALPEAAFEGVKEICDEIDKLNKKK